MPGSASVSSSAWRGLQRGCPIFPFHTSAHHCPPSCLPRIDAWPLQRWPWASQEARMIKKKKKKARLGRQQQRAHRGLSEGWRNVTSQALATTAICHPYCWGAALRPTDLEKGESHLPGCQLRDGGQVKTWGIRSRLSEGTQT